MTHLGDHVRDRSNVGLIAAISFGPMLSVLGSLALAPFLPVIATEMGTTVPLLGQVPALITLTAAALGLVAGPLADYFGHRRLLLVGSGALVVYALITSIANNFAILLLAGLFGAVSRAITNPVSLAVAATHFKAALQRRVLSIVTAGVAGSGIIGVPLLTGVDALYGWRAAFIALAFAGLVGLALSAWTLPRATEEKKSALRVGTVLGAYAPLLRHRTTLGLIASSFLRPAGLWMLGTYISAFLVQIHGLSVQVAALSFTAFGAGLFLGSLAAGGGWVVSVPLRPLVIATAPITGVLLGVTFFLPVPPVAIMGLTFVGFVFNGMGSLAQNVLLLRETPAGRATTMTLNGSAQSLGSAFGSSVGGILIALGGYGYVGIGIIVLGVAAAIVVWLTPSAMMESEARVPEDPSVLRARAEVQPLE